MNPKRERGMKLMDTGDFQGALDLFRQCLAEDGECDGLLYMLGQCCRLTQRHDEAVEFLTRACDLKPQPPPFYLLALGIALQVNGQYAEAERRLRQAIETDKSYVLAYNSLGMTQKMAGNPEGACKTYEAGLEVLMRNIAGQMRNDRASPILPRPPYQGEVWTETAMRGAMFLCATAGKADKIAFLPAEAALEEERKQTHQGLYWKEYESDGEVTQLFLPNYFNTFFAALCHTRDFKVLIGNLSTVLGMTGRSAEAEVFRAEAIDFPA